MKIIKLTISNFLKLKDIEMNPSHTNVIVGKNKQGKTSILKAIRAAFAGNLDQSSIRIGEDKAEILVELDDLNIKRTVTEKGAYLDVSNKEGFKVPAPQKYLDGLLGTFSFNPIEFFEQKPAERKKYLLNAIDMKISPELLAEFTGEKLDGIDYGKHALEVVEDARKFYYDKRTIINADVSKKQKLVQELLPQIPEGFDPASVSNEKISELRKTITDNELRKQAKANDETHRRNLQNQADEIRGQIGNLQQKLEGILNELEVGKDNTFEILDTAELEAELAKLESQRDIVHVINQVEEARTELNTTLTEQEHLDSVVKKLAKDVPQSLISEAKLPVEGLTIENDDVLINGVSLDNLSSFEQLKFGLEIVRKLNGNFKIICIDGIESLDKETFEWFLKEIENDDFQYFVTRVKNNGEEGILIEEGEIKNAETPKAV